MADRNSLIEAELPSLRRYARVLMRDRDRADDLVQDCIERAISHWALWKKENKLRPWLFAILHNLHANSARRHGNSLKLFDSGAVPEGTVPAGQTDGLALRDMAAALALLPEGQRQTVLLVGLEGFSYAEVAAITGVPVGTVMSRLSRARERLRLLMDGETPTLRRAR